VFVQAVQNAGLNRLAEDAKVAFNVVEYPANRENLRVK
jgi:cold shock CspA family protein